MATYYVDASRPDDTGNGLTPATAKKTLAALVALLADGDTALLKAGYFYDPYSKFFGITLRNRANVTIGAYGLMAGLDYTVQANKEAQYPCIDSLYYEAPGVGGWTSEGNGVWSKLIGVGGSTVNQVKRLWVGASNIGVQLNQRTLGTARSRTPDTGIADTVSGITGALNTTDIWHPGGSGTSWKLYMYTGNDAVDPPTYYNGLAMLINDQSTLGQYNAILLRASRGCRISQIHGRGAAETTFLITADVADTLICDDNVITDCLATCMYLGGFSMRHANNNAVGWKMISNCRYVNCIGDTKTSALEQDKTTSYTHTALLNMYEIFDTCYNCHTIDCKSVDSGHVAAVVGRQNCNAYAPEHCGHLRMTATWQSFCTYARGLSTNVCGTGCYVMNCVFDGQNAQSQCVDGFIVGNIWKNMRASIRKPNTDSWIACEVYITDRGQTSIGNDRYEVLQPTKLVIANNVAVDPYANGGGNPVLITTYQPVGSNGGNPNPDIRFKTVLFANNILYDRRNQNPNRWWMGGFPAGGAIYDQMVKNNIVYTGVGGMTPQIKWNGTVYTINTAPGESGTINADPLLDANFKPQAGSPALNAGYFAGFYTDMAGVLFNNPPNIGCYEDANPVTGRAPRL